MNTAIAEILPEPVLLKTSRFWECPLCCYGGWRFPPRKWTIQRYIPQQVDSVNDRLERCTVCCGLARGYISIFGRKPYIDYTGCGVSGATVSIVAASGTALYAALGDKGVFRLSATADSWEPINTGLTTTCVSSLLVSGTSLYAGTIDGGVYRALLGE